MTSETPNLQKTEKPKAPRQKKMSQERLMVMFTLFFLLGIILLVLLPEGHAARGIAMGVYSIVVFWAMFRFGL